MPNIFSDLTGFSLKAVSVVHRKKYVSFNNELTEKKL